MSKLSYKKVAEALRLHHGVLKYAADACGVHRHTMRKFVDDHPELEEVRKEAEEDLLDVGEGHVATAIKAGDMKTVRWQLERKGKNRGYVTRHEETGADGGPIEFGTIRREVVDAQNDDTNGDGG